MHHLSSLMQRVVGAVLPIAETLGGPGLFLIALLDSSFISLPEACDALVVLLTMRNPGEWLDYAAMTTLGSVAGCYVLYALGQRGGEAFVRRRLRAHHLERGLDLFRRFGLVAIVIPAIMPPPVPFKPFVLVAGIAGITPGTFILAVALGRGFRYTSEAWLASRYGDHPMEYIRTSLPTLSLWVGGTALLVGGGYAMWRLRERA